jgi:hypothetical protein
MIAFISNTVTHRVVGVGHTALVRRTPTHRHLVSDRTKFRNPISRGPSFVCPELVNPSSGMEQDGQAGLLTVLVRVSNFSCRIQQHENGKKGAGQFNSINSTPLRCSATIHRPRSSRKKLPDLPVPLTSPLLPVSQSQVAEEKNEPIRISSQNVKLLLQTNTPQTFSESLIFLLRTLTFFFTPTTTAALPGGGLEHIMLRGR